MLYVICGVIVFVILNLYSKINNLNKAVITLANAIDKTDGENEERLNVLESKINR